MEFIMAGTAGQAKAATESVQASIAEGSPATPIGVLKAQKGEMHQEDQRRGPQLEGSEYLSLIHI